MRQLFVLLALCSGSILHAQDTLTLSQAIASALKSNYDVLLVSKQSEEASVLNTAGQAGMLPSINGGVSDQYSTTNIFQRFATGDEISSANASGNNLSAFVAMDWTLFSGFTIALGKQRLEELDQRGKLLLSAQMAQTTYDVTATYFHIVRLNKMLKNVSEIIQYNEERKDIAQRSLDAGLGAKSNVLQSTVDLNAQLQVRTRLEEELRSAAMDLNLLMGKDPASELQMGESMSGSSLDIASLRASWSASNYELQLARSVKTESELLKRQASGRMFPEVTLSGSYNFSRADNSAGFSLVNQSYGPRAGVNVSIPLYNGGILQQQRKVAALRADAAQLEVEQVERQLKGEMEKEIDHYLTLQVLVARQEGNVALAKENLDIAGARFRLGQSNLLDVRQAELSYSNAFIDNVNLLYEMRLSETRLRLLAGEL